MKASESTATAMPAAEIAIETPRCRILPDGRLARRDAALYLGFGQVPWAFPTKYPADNSPYNIATGREMLLIRAEALLTQGQIQPAMALVNQLRTSVRSDQTSQPLSPWVANTLAEAWTALMTERSIELYLEGRHLFDVRRWEEAKVPGDLRLPDFESKSYIFKEKPFSRCFPIAQSERDTNPNIK